MIVYLVQNIFGEYLEVDITSKLFKSKDEAIEYYKEFLFEWYEEDEDYYDDFEDENCELNKEKVLKDSFDFDNPTNQSFEQEVNSGDLVKFKIEEIEL